MVARLHAGDALSHALHDAGSLVSQDAGEQALRICTAMQSLGYSVEGSLLPSGQRLDLVTEGSASYLRPLIRSGGRLHSEHNTLCKIHDMNKVQICSKRI